MTINEAAVMLRRLADHLESHGLIFGAEWWDAFVAALHVVEYLVEDLKE